MVLPGGSGAACNLPIIMACLPSSVCLHLFMLKSVISGLRSLTSALKTAPSEIMLTQVSFMLSPASCMPAPACISASMLHQLACMPPNSRSQSTLTHMFWCPAQYRTSGVAMERFFGSIVAAFGPVRCLLPQTELKYNEKERKNSVSV